MKLRSAPVAVALLAGMATVFSTIVASAAPMNRIGAGRTRGARGSAR